MGIGEATVFGRKATGNSLLHSQRRNGLNLFARRERHQPMSPTDLYRILAHVIAALKVRSQRAISPPSRTAEAEKVSFHRCARI